MAGEDGEPSGAAQVVKNEPAGVAPIVRAGMFGQIEHYVMGENFEEYINRLEMFFLVNDTQENLKVPVFVTVAGPFLYTIATRLCSPADPRTKPYADLVKLLKDNLGPTTNVVAERYKFRHCEQLSSQSITDFIISLKAAAQTYDYGQFLSDALRDLVAGIRDQSLRKKLLTEPELTFDKACSLARSWEAALSQNKEMSTQMQQKIGTFRKEANVHQKSKSNRSKPGKEVSKSSQPSKPCFRCGRTHDPSTCPARSWTCYSCGREGHVSSSCRSKSKQPKKPSGGNRVAEMSESVDVLRLNMLSGPTESEEEKSSLSEAESAEEKHTQSSVSLSILEQATSSSPPGALKKMDSPEFVSLECDGRRIDF